MFILYTFCIILQNWSNGLTSVVTWKFVQYITVQSHDSVTNKNINAGPFCRTTPHELVLDLFCLFFSQEFFMTITRLLLTDLSAIRGLKLHVTEWSVHPLPPLNEYTAVSVLSRVGVTGCRNRNICPLTTVLPPLFTLTNSLTQTLPVALAQH